MAQNVQQPIERAAISLTRRESEILALLEKRLTSPEIAAELTLALNSVKWYIQQIYSKLGVHTRRQAIARARELGLLQGSPSLVSQPGPKHNLPRPLTRFIGREQEIAQVKGLLEEHVLVTLTGSGGVGKTRLALRVAGEILAKFQDGVWFIDLAPLSNPALVSQQVAAALGVREEPGQPVQESLASFLRLRSLLLILDNCEHLSEACACLADALLRASAGLKILATSRELLGVEGETIFYVPSLSTPNPDTRLDLEAAGQYEAVCLFVERSRTTSTAFTLTEENVQAVAQICQQLDGIPLAIELAAARLRLLIVGEIATRLNDAFRLLTGGSRTALPRHQTLRASIDWSYHLLTPQEQGLLRTLSVFAGGWTMEAAEAVCKDEAPATASGIMKDESKEIHLSSFIIHPSKVLDLLGQLVDKSLVIVAQAPGGEATRYRMLETVRQYAWEKLVERDEANLARDRHLAYYLRLVEAIEPELRGRHQIARLNQLEAELGNLRLALGWALKTDLEAGLRLASAMMWFWHIRNRRSEGLMWLEQGLMEAQTPVASLVPPTMRAKALAAAGCLHVIENILSQAESELEESLRIFRELGTQGKTGAAFTLRWLANPKVDKGETTQALAMLREALDLSREVKDTFATGECLFSIACTLMNSEDYLEARPLLQESLDLLMEIGDPDGIASVYLFLGRLEIADHHPELAKTYIEQSICFYQQAEHTAPQLYVYRAWISHILGYDLAAGEYYQRAITTLRDLGNLRNLGAALTGMGSLALSQWNEELARRCLEEGLAHFQATGDQTGLAYSHLHLVRLAWSEGEMGLAAQRLTDAFAAVPQGNEMDLTADLMTIRSLLSWSGGDETEVEAGLKAALNTAGVYRLWRDMGGGMEGMRFWRWGGAGALDGLAQWNACRHPERAARLFGILDHLFWVYPYILSPVERARREASLAQVKAAVGEQRLAELWAAGRAMPYAAAIAYALEESEFPPKDYTE